MTETLDNVLWIGGPSSSGKTTVATRLARRYGLRLYSADTRTWVHRDRALAAGNPAAHRWEALTPAERWQQTTPEEMFEMSLHRERGQMVVDDLRAMPREPIIVAEGTVLPAWVISRRIADAGHAVWLIPSPEFQEKQLAARGVVGGPAALYRFQRDVLEREAREHNAPVMAVDGSHDVAGMTAAVEQRFAAALARGPRFESLPERRALLREINEAIIMQVRGYYARPWAVGDADVVKRTFVCECGDPACEEEIFTTIAEAGAQPILARDHTPSIA